MTTEFLLFRERFGMLTMMKKEVADTRRTINHFDYIVNELLPNLDAFKKEDNLVQGFVNQLNKLTKDRK